jgi:hypothetical protein
MSDNESVNGDRPTDLVPRWVVATAVAGTVLLGLGAFWLSFTALADLAQRAGIGPAQAWVWPVIVDGIILVATSSVVALAPCGPRATWYPWTLLIAGAIVSVSANAAHATVADTDLPGPWAAAISAVPPLVVLAMTHLTVELTGRAGRPAGRLQADPPAPPERRSRERARSIARDQRRTGRTNKEIADDLGVHPSTVGRWLAGPANRLRSRPAARSTSAPLAGVDANANQVTP